MDVNVFNTNILPKLQEAKTILEGCKTHLGDRNTIVLIENRGLFEEAVYGFNRVLRKLPHDKGLDIILESHGGSIDAASSVASLCRERFSDFRVIVPFKAKSAATLLVLAANERFLSYGAQLGPVDPQVRHPENRTTWFPAHSIKDALEQVEKTSDRVVKMAMADKLDPFVIGAYQDAIGASTQYVEEVVEKWPVSNKSEIISAFADKYKSHGYPIDRHVLDALKVPYSPLTVECEEEVCLLHDKCMDILMSDDVDDGLIIMTPTEYLFLTQDFRQAAAFEVPSSKNKSNNSTPSEEQTTD